MAAYNEEDGKSKRHLSAMQELVVGEDVLDAEDEELWGEIEGGEEEVPKVTDAVMQPESEVEDDLEEEEREFRETPEEEQTDEAEGDSTVGKSPMHMMDGPAAEESAEEDGPDWSADSMHNRRRCMRSASRSASSPESPENRLFPVSR